MRAKDLVITSSSVMIDARARLGSGSVPVSMMIRRTVGKGRSDQTILRPYVTVIRPHLDPLERGRGGDPRPEQDRHALI